MELQMLFGRVLLLYQMPKTGSQTVEATLRRCSLPHLILRMHYLSGENAESLRAGLRSQCGNSTWKQHARAQLRLISTVSLALRIRRFLCACGARIPSVEVISGVRDVIGAALSSICENHPYFVADPQHLTPEICCRALLHPKTCKPLQDWFDLELKRHIGIDVFGQPFLPQLGHSSYHNKFARVLLYRFDALPRLPPVLGSFLGCETPELLTRNVGESKQYGRVYRQIKDSLRLPKDFVVGQFNTKLMRHFYSSKERASLEMKWIGNPVVARSHAGFAGGCPAGS
jgi:putative capsular polysaccharide synthesis protein